MKQILINGIYKDDVRVAIVQDSLLKNLIFDKKKKSTSIQGNLYLAKVKSINKALQAVFIEYEDGKTGFLPFSHIHPMYYNAANIQKVLNQFGSMKIEDIDLDLDETSESIARDNVQSIDKENVRQSAAENPLEKSSPEETLENIKKANVHSDVSTNSGYLGGKEELDIPEESELSHESLDDEASEYVEVKNPHFKKYEIQDVIKRDQFLLVQAYKEPKGDKAYMFSTYISLIGRYVILLPNQKGQVGVSKKINPLSERVRIKNIVQNIIKSKLDTCGLIARTGSLNKTINTIKNDYNYCARLWNKIVNTISANNNKTLEPMFLYQEEGLMNKIIRDFLDHRVDQIIIDDKKLYNEARSFIQDVAPSEAQKLSMHNNKIPLFTHYNIEEQIIDLYKPYVSLKSGGYLIINITEALTAIDINSGKSNTESNLIDTAFKINEEAAGEIARQIHLRNISGLIVIDFIDMESTVHKKHIEQLVKKLLSNDKSRTQVGEINQFGLLEMSRQRTAASFAEIHSQKCPTCDGKSFTRNPDSDAFLILRTLENEIAQFLLELPEELKSVSGTCHYKIISNPSRIFCFFNKNKKLLVEIEMKYHITIELSALESMHNETFSIERSFIESKTDKVPAVQQNQIIKEFKFDSMHDVKNDSKLSSFQKKATILNEKAVKPGLNINFHKILGFFKKFW